MVHYFLMLKNTRKFCSIIIIDFLILLLSSFHSPELFIYVFNNTATLDLMFTLVLIIYLVI